MCKGSQTTAGLVLGICLVAGTCLLVAKVGEILARLDRIESRLLAAPVAQPPEALPSDRLEELWRAAPRQDSSQELLTSVQPQGGPQDGEVLARLDRIESRLPADPALQGAAHESELISRFDGVDELLKTVLVKELSRAALPKALPQSELMWPFNRVVDVFRGRDIRVQLAEQILLSVQHGSETLLRFAHAAVKVDELVAQSEDLQTQLEGARGEVDDLVARNEDLQKQLERARGEVCSEGPIHEDSPSTLISGMVDSAKTWLR